MGEKLAGMYAALLTGMSDDGEFDERRQAILDEYVLRQGLRGLYVGGSSGESGMLGVDELLAQQSLVAEHARGTGVRLVAHVGVPNLRDSIRLAQQAETLGYDALSALPPHSYPFTDQEIVDYYRQLSAATSVPLIVYEIPSRTGRPLALETLIEILDFAGVIGMKFSSTDLFKLSTIKRLRPGKLVFSGFDEIYIASAILGADGGIGTTYNVLGRLYVAIDEAIRQGDLARAQELQVISQRFVEVIMETGIIPGVKAALRAHGVDVGPSRKPMTALVSDIDARMAKAIAEPGIRDWLA